MTKSIATVMLIGAFSLAPQMANASINQSLESMCQSAEVQQNLKSSQVDKQDNGYYAKLNSVFHTSRCQGKMLVKDAAGLIPVNPIQSEQHQNVTLARSSD